MPKNAANQKRAEPKSPPPLAGNFTYQERPRRQWIVVQEFGQKGGGCNDGVAKVEIKNDPVDRFFFEKRFSAGLIDMGLAHLEIGLLNQLGDWPGVVKMHDHYIDEKKGHASVYLEYCDAGDLQKVMETSRKENKQVHERKIWQWFIGLMDTLVYMHRGPRPENDRQVLLYWNTVYHRDIKPGNILLKTDFKENRIVAKLADFGCSNSALWTHMTKRNCPQNVSRASALTPGYDPPEYPEYSGATDVWQTALCIACVCSGTVDPWSKQNPAGKRWDRNAPAGRKYSQKLNGLLAWCLTDDKVRRPKPVDVAKRAKAEFASINLPPDNQPLAVFGEEIRAARSLQQVRSSGRDFDDQQLNVGYQRPGISAHAFSDSGVQGIEKRRNRYNDLLHCQRSPIAIAFIDEVLHGARALDRGYGTPPFQQGFGCSDFGPGNPYSYFDRGQGQFPYPGNRRRRW
ncbi:hypothetical protein ACEQ8H_000561 [Pleosporales sp. CAS-2024a]